MNCYLESPKCLDRKMMNVILMGTRVTPPQWESITRIYRKKYDVRSIVRNEEDLKRLTVEDNCPVILIGRWWREDYLLLNDRFHCVLWRNVIPEWGLSILQDNRIEYDSIKKFADGDISEVEMMFSMVAEYYRIATVYGNCHSFFLNRILENTDIIQEEYVICYFPFIQDMTTEKKTGLSTKILSSMDLFIYQPVSGNNKFSPMLDTSQHVLPYLKDDCKRCAIPFTYFSGYFPQHKRNNRNDKEAFSPYGDSKIEQGIEEGLQTTEIVRWLQDPALYSSAEITQTIENSFRELEKREVYCDVKISDYIRDNYRRRKLFYTPSHPCTEVLVELMKRVYGFLGISGFKIQIEGLPENDGFEMLIYPAVSKHLGLQFSQERYLYNRRIKPEKSDMADFVETYRRYNFPEIEGSMIKSTSTIFAPEIIGFKETILKERLATKVLITNRTVFIYLYLDILSDDFQGCVGNLRQLYAPKENLIVPGSLICRAGNEVVPINICSDGKINISLKNKKGQILIANIIYPMD